MNAYKVVIAALALSFTGNALAGTMGTYSPEIWRKVITLSGGPAWKNAEKNQIVDIAPLYQQAYTDLNRNQVFGTGEVFLGLQHSLLSCLQGQFGLAGAFSSRVRIAGDIWQDADPDFNNFIYSYKIRHAYLAAKAKVLAELYPSVQPYLSASIGVGFNRSSDFSSARKLIEVAEQAPFGQHSTTAFSYTLGAGLQKPLTNHLALGLGYEFADWGRSSLTRSLDQTLGQGLSLQHLYTHQLQISLSFVG